MTSREILIFILFFILLVNGVNGFSYSSKTMTRIKKTKDIDKQLVRKSILSLDFCSTLTTENPKQATNRQGNGYNGYERTVALEVGPVSSS